MDIWQISQEMLMVFEEFIFSSPELPIKVIKCGAPVYKSEVSDSEVQRIKIYSALAMG